MFPALCTATQIITAGGSDKTVEATKSVFGPTRSANAPVQGIMKNERTEPIDPVYPSMLAAWASPRLHTVDTFAGGSS